MKKSVFFLTLLVTLATNSYAAKSWEFHSEGDGTTFESRWATTEPLEDKSSPDTTSAIAQINANQEQLSLYIEDPRPFVESLQSLLAGEDLKCTYDNWQLAIDRTRFPIRRTSKSSDNKATLLQAADLRAFWEAFAAGSLMAVRLDRTCDDNLNKITIVYSLSGSKAAIDYVQFKDPVIEGKQLEPEVKIEEEARRAEEERKRKEEEERNRREAREASQKQIEAEKQASQGPPDLSNLDRETRRSIEATCSGEFLSGPVAHRRCLNEQLKSIEGMGQAPDLSDLDRETRRSIDAACSGEFLSGPVAHRRCLNEQLKSIGM